MILHPVSNKQTNLCPVPKPTTVVATVVPGETNKQTRKETQDLDLDSKPVSSASHKFHPFSGRLQETAAESLVQKAGAWSSSQPQELRFV